MKSGNRGFTLIEVLVVITIIAALMGLVIALVGPAKGQQKVLVTTQTIGAVSACLEQLRSPHYLGEYPSADMQELRGMNGEKVGVLVGTPNDLNQGIEAVYVALFLSSHNLNLADVDLDKILQNTDGDEMAQNPTRSSGKELFEIVDDWGNPLAYFSAREMKKYEPFSKYQLGADWGGEVVTAKPWVSEKTGLAENRDKFQLFSAGPDGLFNTPDDIKSWK